MADESVFQDVLSLSIDTDAFAADLQSIQDMWDEAIQKMSASAQSAGIDPSQLIPTAQLQDSITELGAQLDALSDQVKSDFTLMGNAVVSELGTIDAAVTRTEEKLNSLKKTASSVNEEDGGSLSKRGQKRRTMFGVDPEAGLGANFMQGLTMGGQGMSGLAAMAGFMTSMMTIGAALQTVIQGVFDVFMAIPNAIKDGIEYTQQFQQNVSKMQGVLAANLSFSKDFAQNFRMAGDAAKYVETQLENIAAKDNLNPEQLRRTFDAVVTGGGGAMTQNVGDLTKLTEFFQIAVQATGKSSEQMRILTSEIPKLMSGTEGANSPVLRMLGLTQQAWEKIRQSALAHKNLVEQLAPAFAPYMDAIQGAQQNHEELLKQLDLLKERVDSSFAAPVLKEFDNILQGTIKWINENKDALEIFGNLAGSTVADLIELGKALLGIGDGKGILLTLASGAAIFDQVLVEATGTVKNLYHGLSDLWNIALKSDWQHPFGSAANWKKASDDFDQYSANINQKTQENFDRLTQMVQTVKASNAGINWPSKFGEFMSHPEDATSGGQNLPFFGAHGPQAAKPGKQESINKFFEDQLAVIKENYGKFLDVEKEGEAQQTETVAHAVQNRIDIRREELRSVEALQEALHQKYGNDPKQKSALDSIDKTVDNLRSEMDRQNTSDTNAAAREHLEIERSQYKTSEELAQAHVRTMSAIFKRAAEEGLMSHKQAAEAENNLLEQLYKQKRADLESQRSQFAPGTVNFTNLTGQLSVLDEQHQAQQAEGAHNVQAGALQDIEKQHAVATNKINADLAYTETVKDAVEKQDAVNDLLSQRLDADKAYLQALRSNPTATQDQILSAQGTVRQDQLASLAAYNGSHFFPNQLDSSGNQVGTDAMTHLQTGVQKLAPLFDQLTSAVNNFMQALQSHNGMLEAGAAAGGLGSIANSTGSALSGMGGVLGSIGSAMPMVGGLFSAAGGLFSMIGGMFEQQAKNIANDVQQAFNNILEQFNTQQINFTQAMDELNQEKNDAISQLSGTKGGKPYLTQILDQINQTQENMQFQATQSQQQFQIQTTVMQQSTQTAQQWMQTWAQIEEQVKQYLQEGGSTSMAAEFQNGELATQARQLQDQYNQGMQQAIQDNYTLNSLTLTRQQLQLSILQLQEQTGDSIERKEAPALGLAAQQTKLQLEQLQQQLSDTNNQITIEQNKVTQENTLFGLTTDINSLHAEDAALQNTALQEQLANYKSMYAIIQQIHDLQANPKTGYFNGNHIFDGINGGIPGFGASSGASSAAPPTTISGPVTITINLPGYLGGGTRTVTLSDVSAAAAAGINQAASVSRRIGTTVRG